MWQEFASPQPMTVTGQQTLFPEVTLVLWVPGAVSARSATCPLNHSIVRALWGDSVCEPLAVGKVREWEGGRRSMKLRCVHVCVCRARNGGILAF